MSWQREVASVQKVVVLQLGLNVVRIGCKATPSRTPYVLGGLSEGNGSLGFRFSLQVIGIIDVPGSQAFAPETVGGCFAK